jgi:hypothetical protein
MKRKIALLLYGQVRTFEHVWAANRGMLDQYFDYDVFIISANRNSHRGMSDFQMIGEDEVRNIFTRQLGDKIKYLKVIHDFSMREKGTWDAYIKTHTVHRMYGDGIDAFDPKDYGFDVSRKLNDQEFQERNLLIEKLKSYKNGTVISALPHQYLFHEPLCGSEMQCHKREILYREIKDELPKYEFCLLTRPDFKFDFGVIDFISKIKTYDPKEFYTYPNDFYPMSDLFMVGHHEAIGRLCQLQYWFREYEYRHLQELYDLMMKQWPYNEQHNWGSPIGIENTSAYHLIRGGIELKYLSSNNVPRYTNIAR